MSSLKKLSELVKTVLAWESAAAGIVFLAAAIISLVNPALVSAVENFDCVNRARAIAEHFFPDMTIYALTVSACFFLGVLNSLIFILAMVRWQR